MLKLDRQTLLRVGSAAVAIGAATLQAEGVLARISGWRLHHGDMIAA